MESHTLSPRRQLYDKGLRVVLYFCGFLTCALLVLIIGYIFYRGVPFISWELLSTQSSYINDTIGILPNILNTLYIILLSMVIVLPLGVGAAIYLTEYATNRRLVAVIEFATETLTGIPSIIFGLVGMLFFIQMMGLKTGVLAGGLTLVVMILPTIVRTTQESLKTVPDSYREGALAMGAGKWHMVRTVVLPNAVDGIVTGCILAVGRIVGESAALLYTAGFGLVLNNFVTALESSSATLTVALYVYASERGETDIAFAIATILMLLTLVINLSANLVGLMSMVPNNIHTLLATASGTEASYNLGTLTIDDSTITFCCFMRSSSSYQAEQITLINNQLAKLTGFTLEVPVTLATWPMKAENKLADMAAQVYNEITGEEFVLSAIHAGVEGGEFAPKNEDMDIISTGVSGGSAGHTTAETMNFDKVEESCTFLTTLIQRLVEAG